MKTVYVVLPVNNPGMLSQQDVEPYRTEDFCFKVTYADTPLKELNTLSDVEAVMPLVLQRIKEAEDAKASAVIVYAFGDVGVAEAKGLVSIPVMGLGKLAVHMASLFCREHYTVIPSQLAHNVFIEALVKEEGLQSKFTPASHAVGMNPLELSELKGSPRILEKLIEVASAEIEQGVDTFTLGCGSFIGVAESLEKELTRRHGKPITVIGPAEVPFKMIKALFGQAEVANQLSIKRMAETIGPRLFGR